MARNDAHIDGIRRGSATSAEGKHRRFVVQNEVKVKDGEYKEIVLQKLVFDDGKEQLRFGYYIISQKKGFEGKRVWGRAALMLDHGQLQKLLSKATKWLPA